MSSSSPSRQRRDAFRVGLSGRVRLQRASGELQELSLRDLSVTGARLVGGLGLEIDEPVTITFALGDEEIELSAHVARRDPHGCGLRFGPVPRAVENRISRFLTEEQRRRVRPRE